MLDERHDDQSTTNEQISRYLAAVIAIFQEYPSTDDSGDALAIAHDFIIQLVEFYRDTSLDNDPQIARPSTAHVTYLTNLLNTLDRGIIPPELPTQLLTQAARIQSVLDLLYSEKLSDRERQTQRKLQNVINNLQHIASILDCSFGH